MDDTRAAQRGGPWSGSIPPRTKVSSRVIARPTIKLTRPWTQMFLSYPPFSTNPCPTLPAELLCIIFELVRCQQKGIRTLANCCLVSRAMLGPAQRALYQRLELRFFSRTFKSRIKDLDSQDTSTDVLEERVIVDNGTDLALSLFLHARLTSFVRSLDLEYAFDSLTINIHELKTPTLALAIILRCCTSLEDLRFRNPGDEGELNPIFELSRTGSKLFKEAHVQGGTF